MDECGLGIHDCEETAVCVNTLGGFRCDCPPGTVKDITNRIKTLSGMFVEFLTSEKFDKKPHLCL